MKKVYVVTNRSYMGMNIAGVFSTKEKAQECIDHKIGNNSSVCIKEMDLDEPVNKTGQLWAVRIVNGETTAYPFYDVRCEDAIGWCDGGYSIFVRTDTYQEAIKIASERLAYVEDNIHLYPYFDQKIVFSNGPTYPLYHFHLKSVVLRGGQAVLNEYADKVKIIRYE